MTDILKVNTDIAIRYEEVKDAVAVAKNVRDLFETWLREMDRAFQIPFLWITLIDDEMTVPLRLSVEVSPLLRERLNIIDRPSFELLTGGRRVPLLVNRDLRPFYRLFPQHKYLLRSLALAPFDLGKDVVGSLNHGDPSPKRYAPELDTLLLESLMSVISRRLTELLRVL